MNPNSTDPLSQCDQEPVQFISTIQGRGILLAFSQQSHVLTNVSEHAEDWLERTTLNPGLHLSEIVGIEIYNLVLAQLQTPEFRARRRQHFVLPRFGKLNGVEAYVYESDGIYVPEAEAGDASPAAGEASRQEWTGAGVESIRDAPNFPAAGRALCAAIRQITGMDRIMVYRFQQPSWNGEVIAEDKIAGAHSFMDHFFPASDIPKPARDLYLRNRLRFIHDSSAPAWKLIPGINTLTRKPLDLSDSRLRGVSPIHLEYLRNMGVGCSFSIAIIVAEKLWGLVACHSRSPMGLSARRRAACEILAATYAVRAGSEAANAPLQARLQLDARLRDVMLRLAASRAPQADLLRHHRILEEAFQASGVAMVIGEQVDLAGLTPVRADTLELARLALQHLRESGAESITWNNLAEVEPRWGQYREQASGVMALKLPLESDGVLLVFRPEVIVTVKWGGDPRKQLQRREYPGRINPRLSFESWTEITRNQCLPWTEAEIASALEFRDLVFLGLARRELVSADSREHTK